MHALILECAATDKDLLIAELWERGTTGVIEHEQFWGRVKLQAFFEHVFPPDACAACDARWEEVEEKNWVREILESWEPLLVGRRFFVVPDWRDDPAPPGRLRLEVRPGLALGTGYHPTTQMCMEAMERHLRAGDTVFDLGAGSGILSQAALLLGVPRIVACDIDPQATGAAAENLRRAGVPALLYTGSAHSVAEGAVDFLVANISADAILDLAPEIARCLAPLGRAVLSGFEPRRSEEVQAGIVARGFELLESMKRDEWACLVLRYATPETGET